MSWSYDGVSATIINKLERFQAVSYPGGRYQWLFNNGVISYEIGFADKAWKLN